MKRNAIFRVVILLGLIALASVYTGVPAGAESATFAVQ